MVLQVRLGGVIAEFVGSLRGLVCCRIADVAGRCRWSRRVLPRVLLVRPDHGCRWEVFLEGVAQAARCPCLVSPAVSLGRLLGGCWEVWPNGVAKKSKIKQTAHCIQWRGLVFAFARISLSWLVAALWLWLWLCLWFLLLIWLSLRGLPSLEKISLNFQLGPNTCI